MSKAIELYGEKYGFTMKDYDDIINRFIPQGDTLKQKCDHEYRKEYINIRLDAWHTTERSTDRDMMFLDRGEKEISNGAVVGIYDNEEIKSCKEIYDMWVDMFEVLIPQYDRLSVEECLGMCYMFRCKYIVHNSLNLYRPLEVKLHDKILKYHDIEEKIWDVLKIANLSHNIMRWHKYTDEEKIIKIRELME